MSRNSSRSSRIPGGDPRYLIRESFVLPVDETTAETYAEVRDELRKDGRPIPENDIWIAALARQHHLLMVSRDDHFDYVANLRRLAW